jgi:hypothetical protein
LGDAVHEWLVVSLFSGLVFVVLLGASVIIIIIIIIISYILKTSALLKMLLGGHIFLTAKCESLFAFCSHIRYHNRIKENSFCFYAAQITGVLTDRTLSRLLHRLAGDLTQASLVGEILPDTLS